MGSRSRRSSTWNSRRRRNENRAGRTYPTGSRDMRKPFVAPAPGRAGCAVYCCDLQACVQREPAVVDADRRAEEFGPDPEPNPNEAMWRAILDGTDPVYARTRGRLKHLPGTPRCKMCAAPFGGPAGILMRWRGRAAWPNNPDYCGACFQLLDRYHGGAEIESSFLFADIRGSTTLAEGMSPTAFRTLLDRFYDIAVRVLVAHDGIVDKFVGDEVVGIFIPALAHDEHPAQAIAAARAARRDEQPRVRRGVAASGSRRGDRNRVRRVGRRDAHCGDDGHWRHRQRDRAPRIRSRPGGNPRQRSGCRTGTP